VPRQSVQPTLPLALVEQPTVITATPPGKPRRPVQKRIPTSDGRFRSSLIAAYVRGMTPPGGGYAHAKNRNAEDLVAVLKAHGPVNATPDQAGAWIEEIAGTFRLDGERRGWDRVPRGPTPAGLLQWLNSQATTGRLERVIAGYVAGQKAASGSTFVFDPRPNEVGALASILDNFAVGSTPEERAQSVAKISREYRNARASAAQFEGGFMPSRCLRWLNSGRLAAAPTRPQGAAHHEHVHTRLGQKLSPEQRALLFAPTDDE
jgi:hypothetical protein